MFAGYTEWQTPWLNRDLPAIDALVERDAANTIFTRFRAAIPLGRSAAWIERYEQAA